MFFGVLSDKPIPRYEKQLENVVELVLHTIREKKNVHLTKTELYQVLEVLWEYRVID